MLSGIWSRRDSLAEKEMRNFALRDKDGNEIGVFTGKAPRQAALKAANRGHTDIRLRERGTKKVHIFTGERVQIEKPKDAPAWMPAEIWKPKVKKVGMEYLDKPETDVEKIVVVKRRK
jgi:hypothetical protein